MTPSEKSDRIRDFISGSSRPFPLLGKLATEFEAIALLEKLLPDVGTRPVNYNADILESSAGLVLEASRVGANVLGPISMFRGLEHFDSRRAQAPIWTVYTAPYLSTNKAKLDLTEGSRCRYYLPRSKEWREIASVATRTPPCHYYTDYNTAAFTNPLPEYISKHFTHVVDLAPILNLPKTVEAICRGTALKLPGDDTSTRVLFDLDVHFGPSFATPVCITNVDIASIIEFDANPSLLDQPLSVVKMHKQKGEFLLKEVTLREYLENQSTYIAILKLPKVLIRDGHQFVASASAVVTAPTLVIPAKPIISTSETIRGTIAKFLQAMAKHDLDPLLIADRYKALLAKYPAMTKYWDGIIHLTGTDEDKLDGIVKHWKKIKTNEVTPDQVINQNKAVTRLVTNPAFTKVNTLLVKKAKINNDLRKVQSSESNASFVVRKLGTTIADMKKELAKQQVDLESNQSNLAILSKTRDQLHTDLIHAHNETAGVMEDLQQAVINLDDGKPYHRDILFTRMDGTLNGYASSYSVAELELEHLKSVLVSDFNLTTIYGITTSPVKIYVDCGDKPLEECEIVVGGPYKFQLSFDPSIRSLQGWLWLQNMDSIFGIRPVDERVVEVKAHPHSAPVKVARGDLSMISRLLVNATKMCFGEAEPGLVKAFESRDLETIRVIVGRWIGSCWTKDEWGKQYAWFPRADQISNL